STEPDCYKQIGRYELKPDLLVDLAWRDGQRRALWLEVDMATQAQGRIKEKFERYWRAYQFNAELREQGDGTALDVFPGVLFVAIDDARARELSWLLEQGSNDEARSL